MALSTLVFDGHVTLRRIMQGFKDARLLSYLTVVRLSWQRASNSPIDALEDAEFETQSQRRKWLFGTSERVDLLISGFGLAFEIVVALSLVLLLSLFTQTDLNAAYSGILKYLNMNAISTSEAFLLLSSLFVAMSISAVFYVSVGFATYLNQRTIKEGWDIELGFKKLVNRLATVVLALVLFIPSVDALANEPNADMRSTLEEVLSEPEFNQTRSIAIPAHLREYVEQSVRPQQAEVVRKRITFVERLLAWLLKIVLIGALIVFLVLISTIFSTRMGLVNRARRRRHSQSHRVHASNDYL